MTTRTAITILAAALLGISAQADETADYARGVTQKNADAVVTIRLVLSEQFSMPGMGSEDSESITETTGTIINPDGLIIASLSETDPMSMIQSMLGGMLGDDMGFNFDTKVDSVTIVRGDRSETPGKIVIRDADLDLAFIRPETKPESPWPAISLTAETKAQQYDELLVLHRLGMVANRACAGAFVRVSAVLDKPRPFYVLGMADGSLGAPAFNRDGACLGITTMRTIDNPGGGGGMGMMAMFGGMAESMNNMAIVVLPASAVLESATQAPGYEEKE
jgi:hypothetical protein